MFLLWSDYVFMGKLGRNNICPMCPHCGTERHLRQPRLYVYTCTVCTTLEMFFCIVLWWLAFSILQWNTKNILVQFRQSTWTVAARLHTSCMTGTTVLTLLAAVQITSVCAHTCLVLVVCAHCSEVAGCVTVASNASAMKAVMAGRCLWHHTLSIMILVIGHRW